MCKKSGSAKQNRDKSRNSVCRKGKLETAKKKPNEKITVDEWHIRYLNHTKNLSPEELQDLESYRSSIHKGIEMGTKWEGLGELEEFEERKESYEYELLIQATPYILQKKPHKNQVVKWARERTQTRKNTWGNSLARQRDCMQIYRQRYKNSYRNPAEEGAIDDVSVTDSEWVPSLISLDRYNSTPRDLVLNAETLCKIEQLPSNIASSDRERSSEHRRILELQLSGIDVTSKHGPQLGIEKGKVAGYKTQLVDVARKEVAKDDPDLAEKQEIYKSQRGKIWKVKKTDFKKRKALFSTELSTEKKGVLWTRHFRVIDDRKSAKENQKADVEVLNAGEYGESVGNRK